MRTKLRLVSTPCLVTLAPASWVPFRLPWTAPSIKVALLTREAICAGALSLLSRSRTIDAPSDAEVVLAPFSLLRRASWSSRMVTEHRTSLLAASQSRARSARRRVSAAADS